MGRRDGRTEEATPRRKAEARSKGQIARSQELPVAASLLALTGTFAVLGDRAVEALHDETLLLFSNLPTEATDYGPLWAGVARVGVGAVVPVVLVSLLVTAAVQTAQVGPSVKPKAAKPELKRLSPKQGAQRLRPSKALWELGRTAVKLALLVLVVWGPVSAFIDGAGAALPLQDGLAGIAGTAATVLLRAAGLAAVVAAADYLWQRRTTRRDMRMTKDEVRREHKDNEGDPHLKGRRRRLAAELSRNRMLRDVTTADVVVTNPTHVAVALRYRDGDPAPTVVARGVDHLAARIRQIAYRHGVQVVPDPPLARALHRVVPLGGYVPAAMFSAVAVVLATAYRRSGKVLT